MSGSGATAAWTVLWTPGLEEAQAILPQRYARGEVGREDYLQGKLELEDVELEDSERR